MLAGTAAAAAAIPSSPDAKLLAAFKRWIALEGSLTAALSRSLPEDDFSAACTAAEDVARRIASMRAMSTTGMAAKTFLAAHIRYGGTYDDPLEINVSPADGGELSELMQRSLLADAAALLPAIKEMQA